MSEMIVAQEKDNQLIKLLALLRRGMFSRLPLSLLWLRFISSNFVRFMKEEGIFPLNPFLLRYKTPKDREYLRTQLVASHIGNTRAMQMIVIEFEPLCIIKTLKKERWDGTSKEVDRN